MIVLSIVSLFIIVFSILIIPGVVGLLVLAYGLYLTIIGNKNNNNNKIGIGLTLILIGIIGFISFKFDINFDTQVFNEKTIVFNYYQTTI
ncbi:MAG: hypothetical protein RR942_18050 [Romboutsia sp.]